MPVVLVGGTLHGAEEVLHNSNALYVKYIITGNMSLPKALRRTPELLEA